MPRTIPTTRAPYPKDHRVVHLGQLLNVSRSQALGAVVIAWAWLEDEEEGGVVPGSPNLLDSVVEIPGAGQALVDAGLVGVSPDGIVLPKGLHRDSGRAKGATESPDERRRRKDRERKAKSRRDKKLTKPSAKQGSPLTEEQSGPTWAPRSLGHVNGHNVMLLYSRKSKAWFYVLKRAEPKEWTASVADPESPSFAEALQGLYCSMKRECPPGSRAAGDMRPTLEQVVSAAEQYRAERAAAAMDDARRDEANRAAAEAAAEDRGDVLERDMSAPCPHVTADTAECPQSCPQPGHVQVVASTNNGQELEAESCPHERHTSGHNRAPSSSSSSPFASSEEEKSKEETTTTSVVTPPKRDHEDQILDDWLGSGQDGRREERPPVAEDPETAQKRRRQQERFERIAEALETTVEAVAWQAKNTPAILATRCKAARIDLQGFPFSAGASRKPTDENEDTTTTTDTKEFLSSLTRDLESQMKQEVVNAAVDVDVKYS